MLPAKSIKKTRCHQGWKKTFVFGNEWSSFMRDWQLLCKHLETDIWEDIEKEHFVCITSSSSSVFSLLWNMTTLLAGNDCNSEKAHGVCCSAIAINHRWNLQKISLKKTRLTIRKHYSEGYLRGIWGLLERRHSEWHSNNGTGGRWSLWCMRWRAVETDFHPTKKNRAKKIW